MTIVTPEPAIDRDRYGRPLVTPPGGGKPKAYTRCTTYVNVLEDTFNLQKWMQRQVALGLASRPDLLLSVSAHRDDKRELDKICEAAREASASSAAATTGTALHALTELVDRGQDVPVIPPGAQASLDAYTAATKDLTATHIEQFCVQDRLEIGGTPDRVVKLPDGSRVIADLKTGSIDFGILKIAMQLAVYAHSRTYDVATAERSNHDADPTRGLIIHLPAVVDPKDAVCTLHWVDLTAGWDAVKVAGLVRTQRKAKFTDLTEPYVPGTKPATRAEKAKAGKSEVGLKVGHSAPVKPLMQQVADADTRDELLALWQANDDVWSDELTAAAQARLAVIEKAS